MIIIVFGLPGSGKTYFADFLAKKFHADHFNSDRVRKDKEMMGYYDLASKLHIYDEMLKLAGAAVKKGKNVIVDATFYKASIREMFYQLAEELGEKIFLIEVTADDSVIKKRLSKKREESEADFEVYLKIKQQFEPVKESHLVLNSGQLTIAEMLEKATVYLEGRGMKY